MKRNESERVRVDDALSICHAEMNGEVKCEIKLVQKIRKRKERNRRKKRRPNRSIALRSIALKWQMVKVFDLTNCNFLLVGLSILICTSVRDL